MGVVSIIVASLSLIADFIGLSIANVLTSMAAMAPPAAVATPPAPVVVQARSEYVGAQGLSASQRQIVIEGLSQVHALSETRQKQLDGLLADVGQEVIRLSPDNLTTERVVAYATDVREIPSGSGGEPDEMFTLGSGRLQVSDDDAVFFPDNSPSPIRSGGGSYTDSAGTHIATEQIAAIVDRVRSLSNQTINDAQINSLEAELESTSQTLITPSPSVTQAAAQVLAAQSLPDGTIAVMTKNGSMSFGAYGAEFSRRDRRRGDAGKLADGHIPGSKGYDASDAGCAPVVRGGGISAGVRDRDAEESAGVAMDAPGVCRGENRVGDSLLLRDLHGGVCHGREVAGCAGDGAGVDADRWCGWGDVSDRARGGDESEIGSGVSGDADGGEDILVTSAGRRFGRGSGRRGRVRP